MAGEKILVVDDEAVVQKLITHYLSREGFQVITAGTGYTAMEIIRRERPDLIILDILLPELDGLEICREIRSETDVPVIFLTSKSETMDVALGLGVGGDDYIKKPFDPLEMVARVKAHLRRHR
ncbi:MAG: response regulator, partial [Peptococcaceae bacterium]|nr:response regulator [Peptococcaceae bacterium]